MIRSALGLDGGGEGTWGGGPRSGKCIVVTPAYLPQAGNGGNTWGIIVQVFNFYVTLYYIDMTFFFNFFLFATSGYRRRQMGGGDDVGDKENGWQRRGKH